MGTTIGSDTPPPGDMTTIPTDNTATDTATGAGKAKKTGTTATTTATTGTTATDTTDKATDTPSAEPTPSGSPIIGTPKTDSPGLPPPGPKGTGNPYFEINPMVSISISFANMEEQLNYTAFVMNQLALTSMQGVKDAGKSQALGIIEAGKANYNAEMVQGVVSACMAAFSLVQVGMNIYAFKSAKADVAKQEKGLSDENIAKDRDLADYRTKHKSEVETAGKIEKQTKHLNDLEAKQKQETIDVEEAVTKEAPDTVIKRAKKIRDDRNTEITKLKEDIEVNEQSIKGLRSHEKEAKKAATDFQQFKKSSPATLAQLVQNNQARMISELVIGPSGALPMIAQSTQHIFGAEEHLKAAYWNAYSTMASMEKELLSKGMDFQFQQWQSNNEEFARMCQAVTEISQKHASSFMFR